MWQSLVMLVAALIAVDLRAADVTVCAQCHPRETAIFLISPMGRSFGPPSVVGGGLVEHAKSGSRIAIAQQGFNMVHRLVEKDVAAEYQISYEIGAGKLAHSYIVKINGYLFQSPVTWFKSFGWDMSPGYAEAPAIDFDRPINDTCLFCHSGGSSFTGADGRKLAGPEPTAITCDRCHGSPNAHLKVASSGNIVNPGKLTGRARDSVCEQCHLEGEARVLNPGKTIRDFVPGQDFAEIASVYVFKQNGSEFKAVTQVEQLSESRCALKSNGKLWCGTCHNPHTRARDRKSEMRAICSGCHPSLSQAAHSNPTASCTDCHMKQAGTDYAHVAVTDHRILRRSDAPADSSSGRKELTAWADPPAQYRDRNLTLAYLTAAVRENSTQMAKAGQRMLKTLPPERRDGDPAMQSAACDAFLKYGDAHRALVFCEKAAGLMPDSADRAMAYGTALARVGDSKGAERQLKAATRLDPGLKHAFVELWTLYDQEGKQREMNQIINEYLGWNPHNIMFRILKADLSR